MFHSRCPPEVNVLHYNDKPFPTLVLQVTNTVLVLQATNTGLEGLGTRLVMFASCCCHGGEKAWLVMHLRAAVAMEVREKAWVLGTRLVCLPAAVAMEVMHL